MTATAGPHIVGIAGPSGSGKTDVAELLALRLPSPTPVIGLDSYYRDLSALPVAERARVNFDAPEALEEELLIAQVRALARGEPVEKPTYDFATHTRREATERVVPGPFVVVEGLFTFFWEMLRDLCKTKVFLTAEPQMCLARREARDVRERGRTPESVREQFIEAALPMYEKYVWPTRHYADLVLHSEAPVEMLAESVLGSIERRVSLE